MRNVWAGLALSFAVAAADRLTKLWIEASVGFTDTWVVIPGLFQIIHTRNRGMAFGIGNDGANLVSRTILVLVSLAVLGFLASIIYRTTRGGESAPVALYLVLGGAAGNLYDRVMRGSVTDFLDVFVGDHHWPTFNIADAAITIGALLLGWQMWREGRRSRPARP